MLTAFYPRTLAESVGKLCVLMLLTSLTRTCLSSFSGLSDAREDLALEAAFVFLLGCGVVCAPLVLVVVALLLSLL